MNEQTMKITRFEDLLVWQRSRSLALAVYHHTGTGSFARDFGLRDQIRRASVSVMSNIAEGFGRYGWVEFRRFASIALGSVAEVQSQLYLARDLGYLSASDHRSLNGLCVETTRMLISLRGSLENSATPQRSSTRESS